MTACLRFVVAAIVAFIVVGCGGAPIPGTTIDDNSHTAIEQLLDKHVDAIPVKDERSKDYQGGENPCQRVSSRPG